MAAHGGGATATRGGGSGEPLALDPRRYLTLPGLSKGLPPTALEPLDHAAVAAARWPVLDDALPYPLAVLKASALAHNSRWMNAFLARFDVCLAPHGKTTMSPALFQRQLADGAWGITAATVQQAAVMFAFGVSRVLIANQLAGTAAQRWAFEILAARPDVELIAIVDSADGIAELDRVGRQANAAAAAAGTTPRPLPLMVELGTAGGRTGARSVAAGVELARAVAASPVLKLVGVEGYEAVLPAPTPAQKEAGIRGFVADLGELAARCAAADLFADPTVLLSAGGSAYFDLITALPRTLAGRPTRIVLRSGCYLTHDEGDYQRLWSRLAARTPGIESLGEELRPALEVWSVVQSVPEPGLALLTMGKRDVSYDQELPMPRWHVRGHGTALVRGAAPASWRIAALNDQHAFLRGDPDAMPRVGDRVGCAIAHPCTTFDKWRVLLLVDDDYRTVDAVTTWF
ncbi:MAG: amino acid deaminase [Lautropia sp.]